MELYAVIYDESNIDDGWFKIILDASQISYILENCDTLGAFYNLLNTWAEWEEVTKEEVSDSLSETKIEKEGE